MSEQNSKPLYTLTIGEYIELNKKVFAEEAKKLLQEQNPISNQKIPNDIIFLDDVAELTGYKKPTIYSKISRYEIPVLSRRKPLTFSRKALIEWIEEGKPTVFEKEAEAYMNNQRKLR